MPSLASCDIKNAWSNNLFFLASSLLSWHFQALEIIWGVCWDRLRGPTTEGMDKIAFLIAVAFSGVIVDDVLVSNFGIFQIVWCARWPHGRGHRNNCCLVSFQRSLLPHCCLEKGLLESEKALKFCNICIVSLLYRLTGDVKRGTRLPPAERHCWCQGCCRGRILRSIFVLKVVGQFLLKL